MKPTQRAGFFTGSQRLFYKSKMSSSTATVQASTSRHTQLGRETGDGRGAEMGSGTDSRPQTQANACSVCSPASAQPRLLGVATLLKDSHLTS